MSHGNRFVMGDWNAVCDGCGREFKASQLRKDWQGFMMCDRDWEPRHPQDFVRGAKLVTAPAWTRPEPAPIYVNVSNPWVYPEDAGWTTDPNRPIPTPAPTTPPVGAYTGATAGLAVTGVAITGTP